MAPARPVGANDWRPETGLPGVGLVAELVPVAAFDDLLFEGSGAVGGPMDDLEAPTVGRVAEDSFRAGAFDGVPVRDVEPEETAVTALGLSFRVGDLVKRYDQSEFPLIFCIS